jgi:hypothetical protein
MRALAEPAMTERGVRRSCETELRRALRSRSATLECGPDLAGEDVEERAVFDVLEATRIARDDAEHPDRPLGAAKRHVEPGRRRERVRSGARRLVMGKHPLGDPALFVVGSECVLARRNRFELSIAHVEQDGDLGVEDVVDVRRGDPG